MQISLYLWTACSIWNFLLVLLACWAHCHPSLVCTLCGMKRWSSSSRECVMCSAVQFLVCWNTAMYTDTLHFFVFDQWICMVMFCFRRTLCVSVAVVSFVCASFCTAVYRSWFYLQINSTMILLWSTYVRLYVRAYIGTAEEWGSRLFF